ncbi:hypothetical protein E2C01_095227 [Portunus trituberculatus]|uniref:Uncharacterized protein n=1 Tax=Portunus trituberculatus TaxID=210409 RepID=A0A5B7JY82_PORTR|nr:hypothetical protein [Portunus trituberculatus]
MSEAQQAINKACLSEPRPATTPLYYTLAGEWHSVAEIRQQHTYISPPYSETPLATPLLLPKGL